MLLLCHFVTLLLCYFVSCPFPSVVSPEVVSGLLLDELFELLEEYFCDFVFGQLLRLGGDELACSVVVSSFWSDSFSEEYGVVVFPYDSFCPSEDRCIVVEEGQPQMNVFPFWRLVDVKSEDVSYLLASVAADISENQVFRYGCSALLVSYFDE